MHPRRSGRAYVGRVSPEIIQVDLGTGRVSLRADVTGSGCTHGTAVMHGGAPRGLLACGGFGGELVLRDPRGKMRADVQVRFSLIGRSIDLLCSYWPSIRPAPLALATLLPLCKPTGDARTFLCSYRQLTRSPVPHPHSCPPPRTRRECLRSQHGATWWPRAGTPRTALGRWWWTPSLRCVHGRSSARAHPASSATTVHY
jgi:hypothetical protein